MKIRSQRILLEHLELLRGLMESGFTLQEALRLAKPTEGLPLKGECIEDWISIRRQIEHGEMPGTEAIKAYIQRLESELSLRELSQQALQMPIGQAAIALLLLLTSLVARFLIFANFRWSVWDGLAVFLAVLACLSLKLIYHQLLSAQWLHPWLAFLSRLESRIQSGETPQQALRNTHSGQQNKLPPELTSPPFDWQAPSFGPARQHSQSTFHKAPLWNESLRSWQLIWQAHEHGSSLTKLIRIQRTRLQSALENHYRNQSTRASLLALIPLYLFLLPACLIVLLSPIFSSGNSFS